MYILRQNDGHILVESEDLQEVIKELAKFKLREFDRYNVSIEEKLEYERYPYMNELYSLYANASEYNESNFFIVESIFNNPLHIPFEEYIKLEVSSNV
ncbi:hypothetical protein [Mammaliicoccus sciuri]|uniref:hypothetical protein n=1 Tax=Mammaliicoccus sciuri TaxID=1296 RepID=UPI002DBD5894|nr:hypothetical protein [Mammaliicoccus sciuri]MEB7846338.1 hypothetical protein [Mammaliicoccus sciuri]